MLFLLVAFLIAFRLLFYPSITSGMWDESQILQISAIADLIALAERDIYVSMPNPVAMGQKLFAWLDGTGRWLSRALDACQGDLLVLAIANLAKLPHLPWDVLRDREGFLIDRTLPKVVRPEGGSRN